MTAGQASPGRGSRGLKVLDRHLGVWLVLALGCLRRRRPLPRTIKRIALVKTAAIGDTILLVPVINRIVAAFPDCQCRLFLGPGNAQMAPFCALPTEEISFSHPLQAWRRLHAFHADVILDCEPWARISALVCVLAAPFSIGFKRTGQAKHFAFDRAVVHSRHRHEMDNYRQLAAALGVEGIPDPQLVPAQRGFTGPKRLPEGPFIVIHPWPGGFNGERREWMTARWVELVRRVCDLKVEVLISGAPDDAQRSSELAQQVNRPKLCRSIAGRYALREMVTVLSAACAMVAVNTGIMHLAAATGIPVLALNGPTNPQRWGALGPGAININSTTPGSAYLDLGFEMHGEDRPCMESIAVDRVWKALRPILIQTLEKPFAVSPPAAR